MNPLSQSVLDLCRPTSRTAIATKFAQQYVEEGFLSTEHAPKTTPACSQSVKPL